MVILRFDLLFDLVTYLFDLWPQNTHDMVKHSHGGVSPNSESYPDEFSWYLIFVDVNSTSHRRVYFGLEIRWRHLISSTKFTPDWPPLTYHPRIYNPTKTHLRISTSVVNPLPSINFDTYNTFHIVPLRARYGVSVVNNLKINRIYDRTAVNHTWWRHQMETYSRVTGPLCGELTGHRWISLTKASDAELWCFVDLRHG